MKKKVLLVASSINTERTSVEGIKTFRREHLGSFTQDYSIIPEIEELLEDDFVLRGGRGDEAHHSALASQLVRLAREARHD